MQLRGVRPFLSDKYDITKHPNYKYLSDFDKKNAFDVERYMSTRPAIVKPDEAFDIYEIDLSDEDAAAEHRRLFSYPKPKTNNFYRRKAAESEDIIWHFSTAQ